MLGKEKPPFGNAGRITWPVCRTRRPDTETTIQLTRHSLHEGAYRLNAPDNRMPRKHAGHISSFSQPPSKASTLFRTEKQ